MFELNNFESLKIGIASPNRIREWSHGEVTKPETINYRTQKPEKDGLFCERIFGPKKDWQCSCGKYKLIRYKGVTCDKCGVEVTRSIVRRERMGHIELAAPVTHIWYFKGVPSRIGALLNMTIKNLEQAIYFVSYVVVEVYQSDKARLKKGDVLTETEFRVMESVFGEKSFKYDRKEEIKEDAAGKKVRVATYTVIDGSKAVLTKAQLLSDHELHVIQDRFGKNTFKAGMGAEAVKEMLAGIQIDEEIVECQKIVKDGKGTKREKAVKKLELLLAFKQSGNKPEWMIMDTIPVIPPELRPMVQIDGGRFATTDVNDLYRRVINRNNRLKKLVALEAPDVIVRNEKRMLQEAVDALIDNGRRGKAVQGSKNRELKSLAAGLRGKQGRFRNNLLGKRVDYSGRTVIVVGPELKHYQVGIPKEMALELFKPFVMKKLVELNLATHSRSAKRLIEREKPQVWDVLEDVIKDHPVLLNRQPTLHRLSIQAFEPVLVDGRAIRLHPLTCPAFNADFDGDQMTVHVPLSEQAKAEARILMLSSNNILKPSDGKSIVTPTQDIVLGCYYLTLLKEGAKGEGKVFRCESEAERAYAEGLLDLKARIKVRRTVGEMIQNYEDNGLQYALVETTLGRILFNRCFPQDIDLVDRSKPENRFAYEINKDVVRSDLNDIIVKTFHKHGATVTSESIDKIKDAGFKYSTLGSLSISVFDARICPTRKEIIEKTEAEVKKVEKQYAMGALTTEEKLDKNIALWQDATNRIQKHLIEFMEREDPFNPIRMMSTSGARGSNKQIMQLGGMRGIIANVSGRKEDVPTKSNYRLGLKPLEYFLSSRGGRKGLADTALKTADAGYLTRRLADVSQDVIITEEDCFAAYNEKPKGMPIREFVVDGYLEKLSARIEGRYTTKEVINPKDGKVLVSANTMIEDVKAIEIEALGIKEVEIRTVLTCKSKRGICAKCYGRDMTGHETVSIGEAVGIIAAQSIGEPGTQLTMRTKHQGGIATMDITTGLPRVEEILEARSPKGVAIVSDVGGTVTKVREKVGKVYIVTLKRLDGVEENYEVADKAVLRVEKGSTVILGEAFNNKSATADQVFSKSEGRVTGIKLVDKAFEITIAPHDRGAVTYKIPFSSKIIVKEGAKVEPGNPLTEGVLNPHDILRTRGIKSVQDFLMSEVIKVYKTQDIDLNNKHLEIIIRQMLRKVKVEDPGETSLQAGSIVDATISEEENLIAIANGRKPASVRRVLLSITKAALKTESFLSAASFQETSAVLTEAAIKGKTDHLIGLKENVIIGKLIPAGTGLKRYRNIGYKVVNN
ncbi:MAG: DNA-directed RNA polymerase subunit beta' [Firmicutes bacterium]|nr:DNA-directed RNA polymerase subunit beta' [Bacillota bacterium]